MEEKEDQGHIGEGQLRRFTWLLAVAVTILVAIPALVAFASVPPGLLYLGAQFNTDDHMVYAAWMRQAMDGQFLFDNRFAVDAQPGLTIHLYFLVVGWLAKLVSIPVATTLARLAFTFLFVLLLGRLLVDLKVKVFTAKFAMLMGVFGAGLGYLQWANFGRVPLEGQEGIINGPLQGRLSIDVWQPEAFVFPSMLTNGLFMVSLCLILVVLRSIVLAKESWKPVLPGALAMLVLMNIHSYDVLLLALVLLAFLAATLASGDRDWPWITRAAVIAAGALPSAVYFIYVLGQDPVFQARAATETFSPTFRQILFGVLPAILLTLGCLREHKKLDPRQWAGLALAAAVVLGLFLASDKAVPEQYFLTPPLFVLVYGATVAAVALMARRNLAWNLILAWAAVALVAPYFPGLFQRKLSMAMALPWGIMAAFGMEAVFRTLDRNQRNLVSALGLIVVSASSIYWFQRELLLIRNNVSTTTVHPVFLGRDATRIAAELDKVPGRKVLIAYPGIPTPNREGFPYSYPFVPDLNTIFTGLSGVYTFAGHWSETPDYANRLNQVRQTYSPDLTIEEREVLLEDMQVDYIVAPDPTAYEAIPLADFTPHAELVYDGGQFDLYRRRTATP